MDESIGNQVGGSMHHLVGETRGARALLSVVLRGVAQVMFQPHAGTGLLFVVGLAVGSPLVAAGALLGSAIGMAVAFGSKFPADEIEQGIYGFNSALVGLALLVRLRPEPTTWALIVVGSVLASVLTRLMRRFLPFPTYTAPFVLVTWAMLVAAHAIAGPSIDRPPSVAPVPSAGFLRSVLAGEAEVMLGASALTGALFLAGIALSDPRHATIALLGSAVGTRTAIYHGDADTPVSLGIFGYNAALTAMAVYLWRRSLLMPILGALVSVPLTEFFPKSASLPTLTAPFVLATWLVLFVEVVECEFLKTRRAPRPGDGP